MHKNRITIKHAKRIFFGLAALFIMAFGISTCQQTDLFPEYRGTNLINSIPFADWTPDQTDPYMNYEQVTGTGYEPPSGHSGAEVYRLEIKNLISNGDFETSTVGAAPAGWTAYNGGGAVDTLEIRIFIIMFPA